MVTFAEMIENEDNKTTTTNGANVYKSTKSDILDFFSKGGALRSTPSEEIIQMFSRAYSEDALTALRLAFYFRDVREGQGQRDAFRKQMHWLAQNNKAALNRNLHLIPEYGRWDDLITLLNCEDEDIQDYIALIVFSQIEIDIRLMISGKPVSLLAKWMPSENTSSEETTKLAKKLRKLLKMNPKNYRKTLSALRRHIDVLEVKMAGREWDKIDYEKVPSQAMLKHKKAFNRNDNERFSQYMKSLSKGEAKINAGAVYPHDIVSRTQERGANVEILDGMWKALPDYLNGKDARGIVVCDTSASMSGIPINVAVALSIYISERTSGEFKNRFITFSSKPALQKVTGLNIVEKVRDLLTAHWGMNTDLNAVFELILNTAIANKIPQDQMPEKLYIISDMQFDAATTLHPNTSKNFFDGIRENYRINGYEMPFLIFWNVNGSHNNTPMSLDDRGFLNVSGFSPSIFTSLLKGSISNPMDLVYDVVNSDRYKAITL